jgi:GT2 family glycosyltransferase
MQSPDRPIVRGKFIYVGEQKYLIRGVTYGTFAQNDQGFLFPAYETVEKDFALMREAGINTIRTYTPPPDYLLELAIKYGLRVVVGIYWEGRNCIYDDPAALAAAKAAVRQTIARCKRYPDAILAYCIGNEIPPLIARWHGPKRIEKFLQTLYHTAKTEDPMGLVTYGNFPPTEFLQLNFLDLICFNVYLLQEKQFRDYLSRLQVLYHSKPVFLGEVGDDTFHKSEATQAEILDWSLKVIFEKGLCGATVFSWCDEWVVGGHRVEEWKFGLVNEERKPKKSFSVVRNLYGTPLYALNGFHWPRVSVVVCSFNGGRTIEECLDSLMRLNYPDLEIIVVNDGSTDKTPEIASRYPVRLINTENEGLSAARNTGMRAATGSIVAYTDDDAIVDPDWLYYIVSGMQASNYAAIGGPNFTPPSDGKMAQCIACSPGNPTYVLLHNEEAEHIAGVNMAFQKEVLERIGGFDPIFRRAGDDVDICWRIQEAGYKIGFSPSAIVWHHRRPSIKTYLKQQSGYGFAESLLYKKHPHMFNLAGYIKWRGRIYVTSMQQLPLFRSIIYHGLAGNAMFQSLYQKDPSTLIHVPMMGEWYFTWILLFLLSFFFSDLLDFALPMFVASAVACLLNGLVTRVNGFETRKDRIKKTVIITLLQFLQPLARTWGRIKGGQSNAAPARPKLDKVQVSLSHMLAEIKTLWRSDKDTLTFWGIGIEQREAFLKNVTASLTKRGYNAAPNEPWDAWDLEAVGRMFMVKIYTAVEHFNQALRVGYRVQSTNLTRFLMGCLLAMTVGLGLVAAPPIIGIWLLVMGLASLVLLRRRALVRMTIAQTVKKIAEQMGKTEFG